MPLLFIISSLFIIYKFLGLKISSYISGKLFELFGPIFRSKNLIKTNIQRAIPKIDTPKICARPSLYIDQKGARIQQLSFMASSNAM